MEIHNVDVLNVETRNRAMRGLSEAAEKASHWLWFNHNVRQDKLWFNRNVRQDKLWLNRNVIKNKLWFNRNVRETKLSVK